MAIALHDDAQSVSVLETVLKVFKHVAVAHLQSAFLDRYEISHSLADELKAFSSGKLKMSLSPLIRSVRNTLITLAQRLLMYLA